MAEAYNVRSNGQRYYVYRIDGNVQVAEYFNGAEAQRDCAIRNMRHNEQMGKKKELESSPPSSGSDSQWVEKQLPPEPAPDGYAPDPPPGQGVSY